MISSGTLLEILWNSKFNVIATTIAVILSVSYVLMTFTTKAKMLKEFPTIMKFPLVGSAPFLLCRPEEMTLRLIKGIALFGKRFVFWMGHTPYVVILDADGAQKILSSYKYIEKGRDYKNFEWLLGNGLITSSGNIWKEDRKLLSPAFKYQSFDGFLHHFNTHSKILIQILSKTVRNSKEDVKPIAVKLHPLLCRATMDFITESALGQSSSYQYNIKGQFFDAVKMALDSFRMRVFYPWLNLPIIWDVFGLGRQDRVSKKILYDFLLEMINKRKDLLSNSDNSESTKPFIDSILDSKSNEDITAHILTIFGAGFETTASGMNFTLFLLAQNPGCLAKVHEELDSVFSTRDSDVTFDHLAQLKYLEMCIKEALRIFPPAPVMFRHSTEDIALNNEQVIPKGCEIVFAIREMHRDPEHFPDPEKFYPDRFLPDACVARHPYAYIPFSAGPRNCLGMKYAMIQMKACLSHILRNFSVTTNQRREDMQIVYGMVLETVPGIELTLVHRN